jgi:hypothetical protein
VPSSARLRSELAQPVSSRLFVCPRCGAVVPKAWPRAGFDHCAECGIPLGKLALTNELLKVSQKTRSLVILGTALLVAGIAVLAGLVWYVLSLPVPPLGPNIPLWGQEAAGAIVLLWIAGAAVSEVAFWRSRRELRRRGIDSRVTRAAAKAFFPRYAISRLMRSGRLGTVDPVVPHRAGVRSRVASIPPSWAPRFIGYDRE